MPFNGRTFKARHNQGLSPRAASEAAQQANAMIGSGVDEGTAIATASAHQKRRSILEPTDDPNAGKTAQNHGARAATGKTRSRTGA